jgi:SAM-dependent methyltransferase
VTDANPTAMSPAAVLAAVDDLGRAAQQVSLVRLGLSTGLLARCAEPVTIIDLAATVKAPEAAVTAVCNALVALGALRRDGARVQLSADWAPLAHGGLDTLLKNSVDGVVVKQRLIEEALSEPGTYWERDPEQRRAFAQSVTIPSETEIARGVITGLVAGIPELGELLPTARWLELGCGVAGALLTTASMYPGLTAVGVDIAPDLLEVARRRSRTLGVSDRVRFVESDARTYTDDQPFDIVFWSQFFFPADTRKAALENAFARLRPGGILITPVLPGADESPESGSPLAQRASLNAIMYGEWNIPVVTAEELTADLAAVGFTDISVHRDDFSTALTASKGNAG